MPETDPLQAAFAELTATTAPAIRRPGAAAARRSVRIRQARRRGLIAGVAAGAAALGALFLPGALANPGPPTITPTTSESTTAPPSVTPSTSPTATPSTVPGRSRATDATGPCTAKPVVLLTERNGDSAPSTVELATDAGGHPIICTGDRARFFWASYTIDPDGTLRLYRSRVYYLDRPNPKLTFTVESPPTCRSTFYVVSGNAAIRGTIVGAVTYGNYYDSPYGSSTMDLPADPPCPPPSPSPPA